MKKLYNRLNIKQLIGGGKNYVINFLGHNYQGQLCAAVRVAALAAFLMIGTTIHASEPQDTTKVFICTGSAAYAYHTHRSCPGLNRCTATIRETTVKEAKKEGRKFCGYCRRSIAIRKDGKKVTKSNEII